MAVLQFGNLLIEAFWHTALPTKNERATCLLALALTLPLFSATGGAGASLDPTNTSDVSRFWNFDMDLPGGLPKDFAVGTLFDGRPAGIWKVLQTDRAKSPPHVLGQVLGKGAEHAYKVVLIHGLTSADLDLQVAFLPVDGKADMGGGLIWRAADDRNYYLTRGNPLEQNIRLYRVVKGVRQLLQNFDQTISVRTWHTLRVVSRGCRIQVFYDDRTVFDLCDQAFTTGQVGLWTKADAVTYFDDLRLQIVK